MRSHFLQILWELVALNERHDVIDKRTRREMQEAFTMRLQRARATHDVTNAFTEIVRELLAAVERPGELSRHAKLERARKLVERALRDPSESRKPLDLKGVAERVGMSRSLFAEAFRRTYGTTFAAYVLKARLDYSKRLLKDTELKPIQVSAAAGWSSPSYFHQAFRRLAGMTPDRYRASLGKPRR
jgi:AraC-like DNA-binding protein